MTDYESWADYRSYAYITIFDGPIDDDGPLLAPKEPPQPANPRVYSLNPEELSTTTQVSATRIGRHGDQRRNGRYETCNFWELRSALPEDAAPHEHVKNVLDRLRPAWDRFVEVSKRYHATMHLVIKGQNPGMVLSSAEILQLAELHATLDVDAYGTGSDDD
jgi:hypothetical protein